MDLSFHLHCPDRLLQCESEVSVGLGEPGRAERGEEVPGADEGGGELGDVDPDLGPDPAHPGAGQAQEELLAAELSAGEDDCGAREPPVSTPTSRPWWTGWSTSTPPCRPADTPTRCGSSNLSPDQ